MFLRHCVIKLYTTLYFSAQNICSSYLIHVTNTLQVLKGKTRGCRVKAIRVTYSECVSVALVIQCKKRMRCTILSSVACAAVRYFSKLSHKRHDFRRGGGELLRMKCVLTFSTMFT